MLDHVRETIINADEADCGVVPSITLATELLDGPTVTADVQSDKRRECDNGRRAPAVYLCLFYT
jgi:hypothetical protein